MSPDPAPLIVSALFGPTDFAWLDGLRRRHFPPERNLLAAHLTLFHHLPPSVAAELARRLGEAVRDRPPPPARATALLNLGRGTAIRILSPGLERVRHELAEAFAGLLTPQDSAGWRPHVTIQNKVSPDEARRVRSELEAGFQPRDIAIAGIGVWRYRDGPWEAVAQHRFRPA